MNLNKSNLKELAAKRNAQFAGFEASRRLMLVKQMCVTNPQELQSYMYVAEKGMLAGLISNSCYTWLREKMTYSPNPQDWSKLTLGEQYVIIQVVMVLEKALKEKK